MTCSSGAREIRIFQETESPEFDASHSCTYPSNHSMDRHTEIGNFTSSETMIMNVDMVHEASRHTNQDLCVVRSRHATVSLKSAFPARICSDQARVPRSLDPLKLHRTRFWQQIAGGSSRDQDSRKSSDSCNLFSSAIGLESPDRV
jgi:hypothetical protein